MSTSAANVEPLIVVVDADEPSRRALAELVNSFGQRSESFESPRDFFHRLADLPCDQTGCMVVDLFAPTLEGLEIQQRLIDQGMALPMIVVSAAADTALTVKAMRAGALAVLDKPYREHELWSLIQEALAKSEEDVRRARYHRELEARFKRLGPSDRQVLQLILEGCKNRSMAKRLEVSLRTVENRRRKVFDVMQADSVAQLTRMVMEFEHKLPGPTPSSGAWMALPFEQVA